jgi:predicted metal-dependent peptidase
MKPLPIELQAARTSLGKSHDYFNSILWNLQFIEKPGLGTMATDKHWRCYYDIEFLKKQTRPQLEGLLVHEMQHLLCHHMDRSDFFSDKKLFNVAGDLEMNQGILDSGLQLPDKGCFPSKFNPPLPDNKLAEEYYKILWDRQQENKGKGSGIPDPMGCGSCSGNPIEGEDEAPGEGECISKAERDLLTHEAAKQIEQAIKEGRGNVPGNMKRWAEGLLHPQVKWTKELASKVRRASQECAGKSNYTYRKASRRTIPGELSVIKPSMISYLPQVGLIFDTSGSMGDKDIQLSLSECKGVLDALCGSGIAVRYFSVDAAVAEAGIATSMAQVKLGGGGGTDMRVGLAAAALLRPRLDVVVVFTDGDTPWPDGDMPFKVIVVLTRDGHAKDHVPEDYKVIVVN